jgi:hypothetical protein
MEAQPDSSGCRSARSGLVVNSFSATSSVSEARRISGLAVPLDWRVAVGCACITENGNPCCSRLIFSASSA